MKGTALLLYLLVKTSGLTDPYCNKTFHIWSHRLLGSLHVWSIVYDWNKCCILTWQNEKKKPNCCCISTGTPSKWMLAHRLEFLCLGKKKSYTTLGISSNGFRVSCSSFKTSQPTLLCAGSPTGWWFKRNELHFFPSPAQVDVTFFKSDPEILNTQTSSMNPHQNSTEWCF